MNDSGCCVEKRLEIQHLVPSQLIYTTLLSISLLHTLPNQRGRADLAPVLRHMCILFSFSSALTDLTKGSAWVASAKRMKDAGKLSCAWNRRHMGQGSTWWEGWNSLCFSAFRNGPSIYVEGREGELREGGKEGREEQQKRKNREVRVEGRERGRKEGWRKKRRSGDQWGETYNHIYS